MEKKTLIFVGVVGVIVMYYIFTKTPITNIFVSSRFKEYPSISSKAVVSENFKIEKQIQGKIASYVLYVVENDTYLINSDRDDKIFYWKINNKGKKIDSIAVDNHLSMSGFYLEDDYFIDWVITGEKHKKEYKAIHNLDSLATETIDSLYQQAERVEYTKNYETKTGRFYLYIDKEITVIESKTYFDLIKLDFSEEPYRYHLASYPRKIKKRIKIVPDIILPFQEWKNEENVIYIQGFKKGERSRPGLLDLNNTSRSGWNGIGYFEIAYKNEKLNFQTYCFNDSSFGHYSPYLDMYTIDNNLFFIGLKTGYKNNREWPDVGLYTIVKK